MTWFVFGYSIAISRIISPGLHMAEIYNKEE